MLLVQLGQENKIFRDIPVEMFIEMHVSEEPKNLSKSFYHHNSFP